jgi:hypothetical protein
LGLSFPQGICGYLSFRTSLSPHSSHSLTV